MPAKRKAAAPKEISTASSSFERVTGPAVSGRTAKVERSRPFVIRYSPFGIFLGPEHADTFRRDLHPDLRADYVLATARRDSAIIKAKPFRRACRRQDNPPFNDSDTALRGSACLQREARPQVVSEAKDNFRKDDDVRWHIDCCKIEGTC